MTLLRPFRGFRFPPEVILWAVRWYLRFAVSFRDLEEMLAERDVRVDHVSLHRWVQRFAPEIERRVRPHLRPPGRTGTSTRRTCASAAAGATCTARWTARTGPWSSCSAPRVVVTDRLASHRTALARFKRDGRLPASVRHRRGRWLNNRIEQDHRRIKRRTRPMLGFKRLATAPCALAGVKAVAMLAKGQVRAVRPADVPAQRDFVLRLFGVAA